MADTRLEHALRAAARGWRIFPQGRNRKPLVKWGTEEDQTTSDPDIIRDWIKRYPSCNFGAVTGKRSGALVFDVDIKNGKPGHSSLDRLRYDFKIPYTMTDRTPSDGKHLFFIYPEVDKEIRPCELADYPGIEVKADGASIILPGSFYPDGREYVLINDLGPAELPDGLIKLLQSVPSVIKREIPAEGGIIAKGSRNAALTSLAGSMRRRGMGEEAIFQAILVENKNRCDPPLKESQVREISRSVAKYKPSGTKLPGKLGSKIQGGQASDIKEIAPPDPCPDLREAIFSALIRTEENKSATIRRQKAGQMLIGWLRANGGFIRSEENLFYYFYREDRKLFNIESNLWAGWLYALTGANPAGSDFSYLRSDCDTQALWGERRKVVKIAYWDHDNKLLYISRFDGSVYRLDGETWTLEPNGENVLFDDDISYAPYTPDTENKVKPLYQMATKLPAWETPKKEYGLGFLAWVVSVFFTELCPTRPILTIIGEKGSGKSMLLRIFLRFMFGPSVEISGVPDKPDGFTAAANANHLMIIDNLDDIVWWLRDKLARLSTGAVDEYRKLYTSNEVGRIHYRCWLACTSRTPDTLRRDDLSDRLLILPVHRISEDKQLAERVFLAETIKHRDKWWGDLFVLLSSVIVAIKEGKLSDKSILRMGDWESLGRVVAIVEGREPEWDSFIDRLKNAQSNLLLEDDPIIDAIEKWLENEDNYNLKVTSRILFDHLTVALFGDKKPSGWYKSPQSFSKRMTSIRSDLKKIYGMKWEEGTDRKTRSRKVFWFEKREKS